MDIRWNGDYMTEVLALPAAVADEHLRLAGKLQLKVLLWFARHPRCSLDLAACAKDLSADIEDCEDAVRYWIDTGIMVEAGVSAPAPKVRPVAETLPPDAPVPSVPHARPAAVKPQMSEVLVRAESSPDFSAMLQNVSALMGRPLSGGDMETLLYLYDTCGLPAEIVIMITNWAVAHGKGNLRYIEKMALDWADKGIVTIAVAEEYLCRQERRQKAFEQVAATLEISVPRPSAKQVDAADRWIHEWKFNRALLREAYARTMEKTGKFQASYMDRILEGWYEDGITDIKQLDGGTKPQKGASSLDTNSYEELLVHYVPTYPTEKE